MPEPTKKDAGSNILGAVGSLIGAVGESARAHGYISITDVLSGNASRRVELQKMEQKLNQAKLDQISRDSKYAEEQVAALQKVAPRLGLDPTILQATGPKAAGALISNIVSADRSHQNQIKEIGERDRLSDENEKVRVGNEKQLIGARAAAARETNRLKIEGEAPSPGLIGALTGQDPTGLTAPDRKLLGGKLVESLGAPAMDELRTLAGGFPEGDQRRMDNPALDAAVRMIEVSGDRISAETRRNLLSTLSDATGKTSVVTQRTLPASTKAKVAEEVQSLMAENASWDIMLQTYNPNFTALGADLASKGINLADRAGQAGEAALAIVAPMFGGDVNSAKQFLAQRGEWMRMNKENFNQYRSRVTMASASQSELEFLMEAYPSEDDGPTLIQAKVQAIQAANQALADMYDRYTNSHGQEPTPLEYRAMIRQAYIQNLQSFQGAGNEPQPEPQQQDMGSMSPDELKGAAGGR